MKKEFNETQVDSLKKILHKGVSVWIEREKINERKNKVLHKRKSKQYKYRDEY